MKPKKNAAGVTAAGQKELLNKSYRKTEPLSNLKTLIGEILLFGNSNMKVFWQFFEAELRQYANLRISQGSYYSGCGRTGAEKSSQRAVR
jgi:hypothetical protein